MKERLFIQIWINEDLANEISILKELTNSLKRKMEIKRIVFDNFELKKIEIFNPKNCEDTLLMYFEKHKMIREMALKNMLFVRAEYLITL